MFEAVASCRTQSAFTSMEMSRATCAYRVAVRIEPYLITPGHLSAPPAELSGASPSICQRRHPFSPVDSAASVGVVRGDVQRNVPISELLDAVSGSQWASIQSVADKIGVSAETLRNWVRLAERDAGRRPGRREPVVVVGSAQRPQAAPSFVTESVCLPFGSQPASATPQGPRRLAPIDRDGQARYPRAARGRVSR